MTSCGKDDVSKPGTYNKPATNNSNSGNNTSGNGSKLDWEDEPDEQDKLDHYGNPLQMPAMPMKVEGLPAKQGKLPNYHQDGKWLVDESGNHVTLHGCYQTQVPFMTGNAYDSGDGYNYQNARIWSGENLAEVINHGWDIDFVRLHFDTYWFLNRDNEDKSKEGYKYFNEKLFRETLENLWVPIIEQCSNLGLHTVIQCGYVAEEVLELGDGLHRVVAKIWDIMSSHPKIANNTDVFFELINEPVTMMCADGTVASQGDAADKALTEYMQNLIDHIRVNSQQNMIWVPGTTWQQHYSGFKKYPINDHNYGFAAHCYPGWFGSDAIEPTAEYGQGSYGGGYESFRNGFDNELGVASSIAPVIITEMDWAPKGYDHSWGKSITGEAGGLGFGANFKYLVDKCGNFSYVNFTWPTLLATYDWSKAPIINNNPKKGDDDGYLYDPNGSNMQCYAWFKTYREGKQCPDNVNEIKIGGIAGNEFTLDTKKFAIVNAIDSKKAIYPLQTDFTITSADEKVVRVDGQTLVPVKSGSTTVTIKACGLTRNYKVTTKEFELDWTALNPSIWQEGKWNASTRTLRTGSYGFAGWQFTNPLDLSAYSKIVLVLSKSMSTEANMEFHLYDGAQGDGVVKKSFSDRKKNSDGDYEITITLSEGMKKDNGQELNYGALKTIGFWSTGSHDIIIKDLYWE